MYRDEIGHAEMAQQLGAAELPPPIRMAMQLSSKILTRTAYWV